MLGNAYIAGKVMRDSNKRQKHAGVMGCFLRNQSSIKATHLRVARWALVPAKFPANSLRTRCISHETALTVLFTVDYKAFPEFPANSLQVPCSNRNPHFLADNSSIVSFAKNFPCLFPCILGFVLSHSPRARLLSDLARTQKPAAQ
jgi:hypothetical protein